MLRALGWIGIVLGLGGLILTAMMDTTLATEGYYGDSFSIPSQRVHNIGLMNEKQNRMLEIRTSYYPGSSRKAETTSIPVRIR